VLHVALALYMITFSLGIAALILSLLAQARYQGTTFQGLSLLLGAMLLILVMDILRVYSRTASTDLGPIRRYLFIAIDAVSFGLLAFTIPYLGCKIIGRAITLPLKALFAVISAAVAGLGALREIVPGSLTQAAAALGLMGIQGYGVGIVLPHLKRIPNLPLRSLVRNLSLLFIVGTALSLVELALLLQPGMPPFMYEFSSVEILYCLSAGAMLLVYAFRPPFHG
jgi:hypothetical protein